MSSRQRTILQEPIQQARRPRGSPKQGKKPHGPSYRTRRRCPFCGMIVNNSKRFEWVHKHQTWTVVFGGRGSIEYVPEEDPEYDEIMVEQLKRLADVYGYELVPK